MITSLPLLPMNTFLNLSLVAFKFTSSVFINSVFINSLMVKVEHFLTYFLTILFYLFRTLGLVPRLIFEWVIYFCCFFAVVCFGFVFDFGCFLCLLFFEFFIYSEIHPSLRSTAGNVGSLPFCGLPYTRFIVSSTVQKSFHFLKSHLLIFDLNQFLHK